jgi:hypothetical protein
MRQRPILVAVLVVAIAALVVVVGAQADSHMGGEKTGDKQMMGDKEMMKMPFGGEKDVAFGKSLWKAIEGYQDWTLQSDLHPGVSPHGQFLKIYYNIVMVDGEPYHVIVKDNFGGESVTMDMVMENPSMYLLAVTPMVQMHKGYDPEDDNWFYAKYGPDGSIAMNDMDVAMVGRVAKGMKAGCIPCHAKAGGGDFVFWND